MRRYPKGVASELVNQAGLPAAKISTIFNAVIGDDLADRADEPVQHPRVVSRDRPVFVTQACADAYRQPVPEPGARAPGATSA